MPVLSWDPKLQACHFLAASVPERQARGQVPLRGAQRPILQFSTVAAEFHPYRVPFDGRQTVQCKNPLMPWYQFAPYSGQEDAVSFRVRVLYVRFSVVSIHAAVTSPDPVP